MHSGGAILEAEERETAIVKKGSEAARPIVDRARELRAGLARKIALYMGSAENRATGIPGVTLHRRTAPTAPCSATYEPGVTVIAQGRKRVDLGRTTFIYGDSRYLLTSVDLPIVSQIVEASVEAPCLAMSLKLEMPVVRELLNHEEIQVAEAPSDSPAMATGEITVEFLSACCRLIDLLDTPTSRFLAASFNARSSTGCCGDRRARAFEPLPRWEIRATGPQKRSRGSGRTMRRRFG
jgi:hypothetical protein